MRVLTKQLVFFVVIGCPTLLVSQAFSFSEFDVSIDTTFFSGTSAQLAFDFIDGDLLPNNSVMISEFMSDGVLGLSTTDGGPINGALPESTTIRDGSFFNEYLQVITLGDHLSFSLEISETFTGGVPDQFSFFILEHISNPTSDPFTLPLFATTDPTLSDALFTVDITGTELGSLTVYESTSGDTLWTVTKRGGIPVPESGGMVWLILLTWGLLATRWSVG